MKPKQPITVDGALLTTARMEAGMSMDEVAKAIGCNKSHISRWEQGTQPRTEFIWKLVALYKRGDFVKGVEEKNGN